MLYEHLLAPDDTTLPGIGGAVRHFEVVEVPEGTADLLDREDVIHRRKRREQEELLTGFVRKGC